MADRRRGSGSLIVRDQGGGPIIYAKFRDGDRQRERRIGAGWLVRQGEAGAKPNGKTLGDWRERRGRPTEGWFTPDAAREAMPDVVARYFAEVGASAERQALGPPGE